MSKTIEEMFDAGMSVDEIKAAVDKIYAERTVKQVDEMRLKAARAKVADVFIDYCIVLGICDPGVEAAKDKAAVLDILEQTEDEMGVLGNLRKAVKTAPKRVVKPTTAEYNEDVDLDDLEAWLKDWVSRL